VQPIIIEGRPFLKRGPKPREGQSVSNVERARRHRQRKGAQRKEHIAVLDMETDPFDGTSEILPFCAELYSDKFGSIVIWEENHDLFILKLLAAIEALPDKYTIYAHNGGKFDFCYFIHKLRGIVKFKGRAIMAATVGNHELRDSLHILPEKLSAWKKDTFDYSKLTKRNRSRYKQDILSYLHSDCVYLFEIVKSFITEFGFKISIGQAAFSELKKSYRVRNVSEATDEFIRRYFLGGRVECLAGRGIFDSRDGPQDYSMYDVNSMYPAVMANFSHPVGDEYNWRRGSPGPDTVFIDVECRNDGALVSRAADAETSAPITGQRQRYHTTLWEFNAALRHNLISDVEIIGVVDNVQRHNFSKFILPLYERRQSVKRAMSNLRCSFPDNYWALQEHEEFKKQDLFLKYLLNNAYGKFAQNPRNFREYFYTDVDKAPPDDWLEFLDAADDETFHKYSMPILRTRETAVWCKPSPSRKFNNVGTSASITGAARAVLLDAMQHAGDAIYCDTDCLIARSISGVTIDPSKLGAWDLEESYDTVIIAGKKLYACEIRGLPPDHEKRIKSRCKGAPLTGLAPDQATKNRQTWQNYLDLLADKTLLMTNQTPTFNRVGEQYYMKRRIHATAKDLKNASNPRL
jgi:hypothetical protein